MLFIYFLYFYIIKSIGAFLNFLFFFRTKYKTSQILGQMCVHCHKVLSGEMNELLDHCKLCPQVSRPDAFKYKYVCYGCFKFFTYYSGNIKKHISIHLGEKPYACKFCDFKARSSQPIKLHVKKHHSDKHPMAY